MSIIQPPPPGKVGSARTGSTPTRSSRRLRKAAAMLLLVWLVGCAGVPYQEMSDARQALESAQTAVGTMPGPRTKVRQAEALLEQAQTHLGERRYDQARRLAEQAKSLAIDARESAERQAK